MVVIVETSKDLNAQIIQNNNYIVLMSHGNKYYEHYLSLFEKLEYYLSKMVKFVVYKRSEIDGLQLFFSGNQIKIDCRLGDNEILKSKVSENQLIEIVKTSYLAAANGKKMIYFRELNDI